MPLLLVALLLLASPLIAAERTVWSIGVEDGSSREFGRAVRWSDPKDEVVFRVGRSQPAKDWPAMHPGPSNAAANGQPRAYTVVFHVEGRPAEPSRNHRKVKPRRLWMQCACLPHTCPDRSRQPRRACS